MTINPGDQGIILPATYREAVTLSLSGASENLITWTFESGAKISGANVISSFTNGGSNIWDAANVTVVPQVVIINGQLGTQKDSRSACTAAGDWYWASNTLSVYAAADPSGNVESGRRDTGLSVDAASSYLDINGGEIYGTNSSAISVAGSPSNIRFNNSSLYSTTVWGNVNGIDFNDAGSSSVVFNRLLARNNSENGFYFRGSSAAALNYSFARANGLSGVKVGDSGSSTASPTINNVTSAYNATGLSIVGSAANPTIRNSIFSGNTTNSINSAGQGTVTYSCLNGPATWGNTMNGTGNISSDPRLTSSTDFNLQSSSPAINAAVAVTGLNSDFSGNAVPTGQSPDMGAYEFQGTPTRINGQCGSANNNSYTSIPHSNLCLTGSASTVSGSGPWTWSCQGIDGGDSASCQADKDYFKRLDISFDKDDVKDRVTSKEEVEVTIKGASGIKQVKISDRSRFQGAKWVKMDDSFDVDLDTSKKGKQHFYFRFRAEDGRESKVYVKEITYKRPSYLILNKPKRVRKSGSMTQSGEKFSPNSTVALYFSKTKNTFYAPLHVRTDDKGKFEVKYVANKPAGWYWWYAVDLKTGKRSEQTSYEITE